MRRRRIIMFFAMIMSVAIIGVGFAAWIITAPTAPVEQSGTITVDTVKIQGWTFETYWVTDSNGSTKLVDNNETDKDESKPVIYFGKPTTPVPNAWLDNPNDEGENLKAYLYVKANKLTGANVNADYTIIDTANVTLSIVKDGTETESSNAVNYTIDVPKTISNEDLVEGVVITITFNWKTPTLSVDGESVTKTGETKNENPYTYYNGLVYSSLASTTAQEYLAALNTELSGATFKVTLAPVTVPASKQ